MFHWESREYSSYQGPQESVVRRISTPLTEEEASLINPEGNVVPPKKEQQEEALAWQRPKHGDYYNKAYRMGMESGGVKLTGRNNNNN